MDDQDLARDVIHDWEERDAIAGQTLTHWQQITNYMDPNRADYTTYRSPGQKRMTWVYDSYPLWAREQFRAACHSFLTSSTLLWFNLAPDNDRINQIYRVRQWLDAATLALYAIFNSARYNFASQSQEVYDDVAAIGTACMGIMEGKEGMPLFTTRHMRECRWAVNDEDRVDTLSRKWQWTARQAVRCWGKKAGEKVFKAYQDDHGDRKFWFHHRVQPRRNRDPQRADKLHMAFESVYVGEEDHNVVSVGGNNEFVYLTPRFSVSFNEVYGRGPGSTALPDVKMLNEGMRLVVKASQKTIDPPLEVPDNGYIVPIRTVPGSLIFRRPGLRPDDRISALQMGTNIPLGEDMLNALRTAIGRVFFVDLLHMPSDPQDPASEGKGSTATYWQQRRDKEMMALSPFLARMNAEWNGPLIDRCFALLWRKSKSMKFGPGSPFPPPPPELSGQSLHVEYTSPIALAQRSSENDAIDRLLQRQLQLRQIDPQSPLIIDVEWIMRRTQLDVNAPIGALKSPEVMQQEAQQKAQAEQAAAQHAQLQSFADAAQKGTAAVSNLADANATMQGGGGGPANENAPPAAAAGGGGP
jgi:hypothetical protein